MHPSDCSGRKVCGNWIAGIIIANVANYSTRGKGFKDMRRSIEIMPLNKCQTHILGILCST